MNGVSKLIIFNAMNPTDSSPHIIIKILELREDHSMLNTFFESY